jgi:anti-sigma factor RsiW
MRAVCEHLYLFIDGQLDETTAARFRAHLAGCHRCPQALESALVLDALAEQGLVAGERMNRTVEVPVAPAYPWAAPPPPPQRPTSRRERIIAIVTAAVAVAGGLIWLLG